MKVRERIFDEFTSRLVSGIKITEKIPVIKFAEEILFNGETELFITQRVILKAFYGEELEEKEIEILEEWVDLERTTWVKGRKYKNTVIEAGRGGTKSTIASVIALYEFYSLITLESPSKYYGLLPNDPIAIFVIATTLDQVKDTLFGKIKGFAEESLFFQSLEKAGKIIIQEEKIKSVDRNVAIYAKHTNSPALVGYNIKCLILDEVARFDNRIEASGKITSLADEIWDNVGVGTNRFGKEGKKIAISSAWGEGDPIARFLEVAERDPDTLGIRLRAWDLNLNITRETFNSDYIKDRAKAELEYEGIRRGNIGGFFNQSIIENSLYGNSCIDIEPINKDYRNPVNIRDIKHYVEINIVRIEELEKGNTFVHIDYSTKRDATGLSIVRPYIRENEEGLEWYIKVEGLIKWIPGRDKKGIKRVISYKNIEDVVSKICKYRKVRKLTYDCFNSASSIQYFHTKGITTEETKVDRKSQLSYYTLTNDLLSEGKILIAKDSLYTSSLISELTNIIVKPNGQIIHGKEGKDLSDAFVNSIYQCYQWMVINGMTNNLTTNISTSYSNKLIRTEYIPIEKVQLGKPLNRLNKFRNRPLN